VYAVEFPPLAVPCLDTVSYYVSAQSSSGPVIFDPPGAPNFRFVAVAASSMTAAFRDDFQTHMGWTVTGSAVDGQWQRAVPAGGGDRGDPPTDADGSGMCFVTDNADDNSDVDQGTTILTSPVLDASNGPAAGALVAYQRWYSNNIGAVDDIFRVQISNNGGSSWVTLETVAVNSPEASGGWYEKVFRIADTIAPTSTMRLRFLAQDLGTGSVVEAGVDNVRILHATCAPPRTLPAPTTPVPPGPAVPSGL
jgi:hypothetical protein